MSTECPKDAPSYTLSADDPYAVSLMSLLWHCHRGDLHGVKSMLEQVYSVAVVNGGSKSLQSFPGTETSNEIHAKLKEMVDYKQTIEKVASILLTRGQSEENNDGYGMRLPWPPHDPNKYSGSPGGMAFDWRNEMYDQLPPLAEHQLDSSSWFKDCTVIPDCLRVLSSYDDPDDARYRLRARASSIIPE